MFRQDIFDDDEFIDILDRFNCRSRVCQLNVYGVILEIAKQELVQKPYLMVSTWSNILTTLKKYPEFSSVSSVIAYYNTVKPTTKRVLKMLQCDPLNDAERDCLKYLQNYIRGLDQNFLAKFLHFCTGSNIIIINYIKIDFVKMDGLARRPIAHTCAPMLELASSYRNFCELREEFQNILSTYGWGIDTI